MYLLLKRQYIRKLDILECQKIGWSFAFEEVLLPKHISISSAVLHNNEQENYHCHSTPARSLWCVCFTKDGSDCISLLKVDYSMSCLSPGNGVYRKLVAACAIFPFLSFLFYLSFFIFPLLLLIPLYKYRKSRLDNEICFGFKVFFENYREKYWFWEIVEMYRKLILISGILLFDSKSHSQIDFAVISASALVISHTMVRPIKGKFEDRLQACMLWIIFFNVCLGAIYLQPTILQNPIGNESIFVFLNSAVVLIVVGKFYLLTISNDRFCQYWDQNERWNWPT